ncbi:MAG: transglycosylase domain-containing protein, partial [Acidobacteriota bacterium]
MSQSPSAPDFPSATRRLPGKSGPASGRLRWILATVLCWALAVGLGIALASLLQHQMPQVLSLEDYSPPVLSRIYAADGTLLQQFGEQRRIVVPLSDLPTSFKEAIVAIEDADFYSHPGIDLTAIVRAVWRDLLAGQKAQGASTITQQLARDLFLTKEKEWGRKLQEWLLALQVEKSYTKDEILELYCNQIYFGHGFYGIEAASRFYYGKPASALSLDEAALLAGLVQRPEVYSPLRSPQRARRRRDHVLRRMVAVGDLTPEMARSAMERPVSSHPRPSSERKIGLYFLEEVRKNLMKTYGEQVLYKQGMEIHTTLDQNLQALSERVLRRHLEQIDRVRGFRPITRNVIKDESVPPEEWRDPSWGPPLEKGQSVRGVVLSVDTRQARIRMGQREGLLQAKDAAWTGQRDLRRILSRGDVTLFSILDDTPGRPLALRLNQEPQVEGAVVVLETS